MAGERMSDINGWQATIEANARKVNDVRLADESGTFRALEEAGYKASWQQNLAAEPRILLQKRIKDEVRNTLYFINVWAYDWRKYRPRYDGPSISYTATVQFNTFGGESFPVFNVEMLLPNRNEQIDVPATEQFFADIYARMGCVPYETSNA